MSFGHSVGKNTGRSIAWCIAFILVSTAPAFAYESVTDLSTPQNLTAAAGQLYDAGDYRTALEKLDSALLISPDMVGSWYLKGQIYLRLEKYPFAIVAFDRAIQLDPGNSAYWCGRGDAFFAQQQYRNALASYESAIAYNPHATTAILGKARSQLALGLYAPAVASFDQVLGSNANSIEAWFGKGVALKSLGEFNEASRSFEMVIRLDPGNVPAWENKGNTLSESGDVAGAIGAYEQVLLRDPKRDDIRQLRDELQSSHVLPVTPTLGNSAPLTDDSGNSQQSDFSLFISGAGVWVVLILISCIVLGIIAMKRVRTPHEPEPVFTIDTTLLKKEIDEFTTALPEMQILPVRPSTIPAPDSVRTTRQPCEYCGKYLEIPVACAYCKRFFCPDHASPPDHACSYTRDWERAAAASGDRPLESSELPGK